MADKIAYLSQDGLEKIKAELVHLKTVRRRELAERIAAAKALGDLSENAEYHEAKDDLGFVEGRIMEIEDMLKNVSVIDEGATNDIIRIGTSVTVQVGSATKTYKIVGSNEANPMSGLISNESPLGSAFLGARAGETVTVETPAGKMSYKILSVA